MIEQVVKSPKVTLTVSCPLELYNWLKRTQRNVSSYIVQAIEAEKRYGDEMEARM